VSGAPPLEQIIEGALLAAGGPLTLERLLALFADEERPSRDAVLDILASLERDYRDRGIELVRVAGGFRVQVRRGAAPWVARLWEERPARYSRALLETLALIAYRQPITRGEIEVIRGVAVSTHIIRTLTEREWVRNVGHRDVPGRPALYATTRKFLDYFGLGSLNELPPLAEIRDPAFLDQAPVLEQPKATEQPPIETQASLPAQPTIGEEPPNTALPNLEDPDP